MSSYRATAMKVWRLRGFSRRHKCRASGSVGEHLTFWTRTCAALILHRRASCSSSHAARLLLLSF
ncbi:hypothetical protein AMELA_G00297770 [Ameiurus melas]|uniref:Uncharacterized protein n=1 Tax=Ameiurus melas TaxID=219545 RepID=A0A7J5ZHM7_AMEME|nr:hypothetical protein AMELA_G00297770 [Ameiurus melas]